MFIVMLVFSFKVEIRKTYKKFFFLQFLQRECSDISNWIGGINYQLYSKEIDVIILQGGFEQKGSKKNVILFDKELRAHVYVC